MLIQIYVILFPTEKVNNSFTVLDARIKCMFDNAWQLVVGRQLKTYRSDVSKMLLDYHIS